VIVAAGFGVVDSCESGERLEIASSPVQVLWRRLPAAYLSCYSPHTSTHLKKTEVPSGAKVELLMEYRLT